MKQICFNSNILPKSTREFGGALNTNKRKIQRPLCTKRAIHLVLRADVQKSGSLLRHKNKILNLYAKYAQKFKLRIYKSAIASNHIHIVIKIPSRHSYNAWIRAISSRLKLDLKINLCLRPWSRVLNWGKDFLQCKLYVLQNILEAEGVIPYQPRRVRGRMVMRAERKL